MNTVIRTSSAFLRSRPALVAPLALLLLLLPLDAWDAELQAQAVSAAPTSVEGGGAAALGVALRRLGTTKRVLMIAAHPDDENTALIAELALGDGADVAYLSLTRGEGGQNLIGPELQEGLGLIRSEELLTARRLDGARQFFTRAYDFGYSRSAEETLTHWPRDTILGDVVEIIRRYRPDIVVSVFSGTPADGHGHHQAAGIMAAEAFAAAADPARFPRHAARGLRPHAAHYLFQSLWRPPADPPITLATGDLDPLFGRSRYQIAMQSRSRHRSQDMGQAEALGPQRTALRVMAGPHPRGARSLFAGLDTTLAQHARSASAGDATIRALELHEQRVQQIRAAFNPLHVDDSARQLIDARALLLQVATAAADPYLAFLVREEIARVEHAVVLAAGIVVDAVADTPMPAAGESFTLTLTAWNGGDTRPLLSRLEPLLPEGWTAAAMDDDNGLGSLAPGTLLQRQFRVTVPASATPTEPYFLRAPRPGSWYAWDVADHVRGLPFEPRPVRAVAEIQYETPIRVERDAHFVTVDKSIGELRQPLLVVPPVAVTTEPRIAVIPAGDNAPRSYTVTVTSAAASAISGTLRLAAPAGWTVEPAAVPLTVQRRGQALATRFTVTPPPGATGEALLQAHFETDRGSFHRGYTIIDYPHTRPHALYSDATIRVASFPVSIAADLRVGYIEGAGDDGALALRQLGATVDLLDAAALAGADLSVYDAIVAGIRAYEVRADLIAHNARLLDYARGGGTIIIQYNKYELVEGGGFMPFPATMARPHGRVTDHQAPVTLLAPDHPLLAGPNRITTADFDGWVQERGLYFLHSFDAPYTPLLAMGDPGQQPLHGGLVAAPLGEGWYVYTGLALFRQLPEAVPGAYRLLANLVSLGRAAPFRP
jgi:LmbE family N-acetylglucosaminyl deacetylase